MLDIFERIMRDFEADMHSFAIRSKALLTSGEEDKEFAFIGKSFPRFDIAITDDTYEIVAAVPGYKKEDIEIEVVEDTPHKYLSLKSCKQSETKDRYLHEIHRSSFHRSLLLPADADSSKIESSLSDGLLNITIPRIKKIKQVINIK
jgi:HSP20 family protein